MRRLTFSTLALASGLLAAAFLAGCGGDDGTPDSLRGPFVRVMGTQSRTFAIDPDQMDVTCTPKPGLTPPEFAFVAAERTGPDSGNYFAFTVQDYTKPQTYELDYSLDGGSSVNVSFDPEPKAVGDKRYAYFYFQENRTDTNEIFSSKCTVDMDWEPLGAVYRYTGTVACVMLFSHFDSADYSGGLFNNSVDLVARFECEN